jgi:dihydroorotate dehydrogenase (NAD+) catalytic subunit
VNDRLAVDVGGVELINPIVCGSGEHLIEPAGVLAAIERGAGAVVVKSTNESEAARRQLAHTDYALFDSTWQRLDWNFEPPADASLLNRSGLFPHDHATWLEMTSALVAQQGQSVVVPSIIPASYEHAVDLATEVVARTRCRVLEVNIGAPHGREAAPGTIALESDESRVRKLVSDIRGSIDVPLWLKLTGQSDDVTGLAAAAFDGGADAVTLMGRFMAFLPDIETQAPALGTMAAFGGGWALPLTCRWLALTRMRVGPTPSLLATNGARNGLDVVRFLLAGASAVQMNSAIFTGGFDVIGRSIDELDRYLADRGDTAAGIVGRAADRLEAYTDQPVDESLWQAFVPPEARPSPQR